MGRVLTAGMKRFLATREKGLVISEKKKEKLTQLLPRTFYYHKKYKKGEVNVYFTLVYGVSVCAKLH